MQLSIILPIFNVEKYLTRCLDSLYNQDIPTSEYEIICIDDASPDNSLSIVHSYAEKNSNIVIIKHPYNKKQGSARNSGLAIARGTYIWFIDSDDYIEPNCLGFLLREIGKDDLDVIHFDYKQEINGIVYQYRTSYQNTEVESGDEFLVDSSYETWWKRCVEVWRRIQKKSFLIDNNLIFAENVMFEDTDYSLNYMNKVKRIRHINVSPYIYCQNTSSTTNCKKTPELIKDYVLQLCRCASISGQSNHLISAIVKEYVYNQSSIIKISIKDLSLFDKMRYWLIIRKNNISILFDKVPNKTWRALKYGFVISANYYTRKKTVSLD